jgi:hypothetical protein
MAKQTLVKVFYKGKKASMPINFPIGIKSQGGITKTEHVSAGNSVEMGEDDAHKLIALDSHNFEIEGVEKSKYVYIDRAFVPAESVHQGSDESSEEKSEQVEGGTDEESTVEHVGKKSPKAPKAPKAPKKPKAK